MALDLLIIIAGIIYGYVHPGKEDRLHIIKKSLKYGLVIGAVFGVLGLFTGNILVALARGIGGTIGLIIMALIISIYFVIGTLVGDFLEEKFKKE